MEIKFNLTKEERKNLVKAVGEITGWTTVYKGAPSFAYAVNNCIIDKDGSLIYDGRMGTDDVQRLLSELSSRGFIYDGNIDLPAPAVYDRLTVEVPLDGFTDTAFDNLERLISGKSALIMKAVGADSLPIEKTETALRFAWFSVSVADEEINAYTLFINAICDMAKKQKRVTMKESAADSEKFTFRCFLLRLGFIGAEYAPARIVLLSKLSGSSAFARGDRKTCVTP